MTSTGAASSARSISGEFSEHRGASHRNAAASIGRPRDPGQSGNLTEVELGPERRAATRVARRAIGRPKALDDSKAALAQRMHASGDSANSIAAALGVSRATVYRVLALHTD